LLRRVSLESLLEFPGRAGELRDALVRGGVAAIPTETFYGLAASPRSAEGCARIVAMKGRSEQKALPVVAASSGDLEALGIDAPPAALLRFAAIWPAALTVVFALREPLACSAGERSLAVRVPAHAKLRHLLSLTGPLTATSANLSGAPALDSPDRVFDAFGGAIDVLVDGGDTPGGLASTIVDARFDPPRVVRAGAFPWPETG
jgi:tRNA threonylcarbamoyl adenosine modification protein (Sua5/YciO/YrdC/YwlC family)